MILGEINLIFGDWKATVLPDFGANLIKLSYKNKQILRSPNSFEELNESPYTFGTPLLFPANRTRNGEFFCNGIKYHLPVNEPQRNNHLHGRLYNAKFSIIEKTENSLHCRYVNLNDKYPLPFLIDIIDTLSETGYRRKICIENCGNFNLPFTMALHTTFLNPDFFSVPIAEYCEVDENFIPTGKTLPLDKRQMLYKNGFRVDNSPVSGFYKADGNKCVVGGYTYSFSDNFTDIVLFNNNGNGNYLCIEPQAGEVNGLNTKGGHLLLKPGEIENFITDIMLNNN